MNGDSHGSSDEYTSSDDEPEMRWVRVARCPGNGSVLRVFHQEVWYWPNREMMRQMNNWRAAQGAGQDGQGAGGQMNIVVNAIQNNGALQSVAQPFNLMEPVWDLASERQLYVRLCGRLHVNPEPFQVPNDPVDQAGYQVPPRQFYDDLTWHGYGNGGMQRWYRWDRH